MEIREAQIEDILVNAPELTKKYSISMRYPFCFLDKCLSLLADLTFSTLIKQTYF